MQLGHKNHNNVQFCVKRHTIPIQFTLLRQIWTRAVFQTISEKAKNTKAQFQSKQWYYIFLKWRFTKFIEHNIFIQSLYFGFMFVLFSDESLISLLPIKIHGYCLDLPANSPIYEQIHVWQSEMRINTLS